MKKTLFTLMSVSLLLAGCGEEAMPTVVLPEIDTTNPLLAEWDTPHQTPPFEQIKLEHYKPAFQTAIAVSRAEVDAIVNNPAKPTFANTILALEKQGALLNRIAGIFFNLNEADTSDELQAIAIELQPELTALSNDISLNPELFKRVKYVYEHPGLFLSKEDKQLLEKSYKDFVRSGANLSEQDKELYRQYTSELSSLTLKFGQNSLAATNAYSYNITNPKQVEELPSFVKEGLAIEAKARGEKGWTVTLRRQAMFRLSHTLHSATLRRSFGRQTTHAHLAASSITLRISARLPLCALRLLTCSAMSAMQTTYLTTVWLKLQLPFSHSLRSFAWLQRSMQRLRLPRLRLMHTLSALRVSLCLGIWATTARSTRMRSML